MKRYFVTGTGTGVGKTFVTCRLASLAVEQRLEVVAHKPIETGCVVLDGRRQGEDQQRLLAASSPWLTAASEQVKYGCYQFAEPLAPSVAAALEGRSIDLDTIQRVLDQAARTPSGSSVDLSLVEGAGGWRVPITEQHDMRDLARMVGGQVIVVGLGTLGTINHSLLSVEVVERDGFEIAALVLSNRPEDDLVAVERNRAEIRKRWPGLVLLVSVLAQLLPLHVERRQPREDP